MTSIRSCRLKQKNNVQWIVDCLKTNFVFILLLSGNFALVGNASAATVGLPFIEDFSSQDLMDNGQTSANWSTVEKEVTLALSQSSSTSTQPSVTFGLTADSSFGTSSDATYALTLGDVDDDGDLDVQIGNNVTNKLYLNDGSGIISATSSEIGGDKNATYALTFGDIDGDGDLDILTGNYEETNKLYLNDGSGSFNTPGISIGEEINETFALTMGDVDGDGDLDVISGNFYQINKLYLNDGNGNFSATGSDIGTEANATVALTLGDVDGDGDLDLLVGNNGQTNKLYLNDSDGNFSTTGINIGSESDETLALILGDMDEDGDLDVLAGNFNKTNKLYFNDGNGDFSNIGSVIGSESEETYTLALGDVDGDGDVDVLSGNFAETNKLYLNDGSGSFDNTGSAIGTETDDTWALTLGDVDKDGDLDVLSGNLGQSKLYLNDGLQGIYQTHAGRVVSLKTNDTETDIWAVRLDATQTSNTITTRNTKIDYYLSNNGGTKWYQVSAGKTFIFPDTGTDDLRWKAELRSLSPVNTPLLSQIELTLIEIETIAPTISEIEDQATDVSAVKLATFTIDDADTDVDLLELSATSSNPTILPVENIVFRKKGSEWEIAMTPAFGITGSSTVVVTVSDGQNQSTTTFEFVVGGAGVSAPTISVINDQMTDVSIVKTVNFTINDADTDVNALELSATSSNLALLPIENIIFRKTGSEREVALTPVFGLTGTSTVVITVSDGQNQSTTSFEFVVGGAGDAAPTISLIENQMTDVSVVRTINFTINDADTDLTALQLSATSSNTSILPVSNIVFRRTGSDREVSLTPVFGLTGTSTVVITVSDGQNQSATSFEFVVGGAGVAAPSISVIENQTTELSVIKIVSFTIDDTDTDVNVLQLSATSSNPDVLPVGNIIFRKTGSEREVVLTPVFGVSGTSTVVITVSDGQNQSTTSFEFEVTGADARSDRSSGGGSISWLLLILGLGLVNRLSKRKESK